MEQTPDIARLCSLGNLALSSEQLAKLSQSFPDIVEFIDHLARVASDEVVVTNQVTDLENVFRPDEVIHFAHHRTLLEAVPDVAEGFVKVPGVFADNE